MRVSRSEAGMQPPDGPADLHGLELAPVVDAAADVLDDLADGGPHRHLDQPAAHTLPASAKTLVPLLLAVPKAAYASAPWRMIHGTFA